MRFYFDYISSNAYLAWARIHELAGRHGRRVEPVPVLFAGLLEAHGQLGPAEVPAKSVWMCKNTLRKAALLGVPLNPPAHHPWNPLLALRVSSLPMDADARRRLIDALFAAAWQRGLHLSDAEVVAAVLDEAGLDGRRCVREAGDDEAKSRLRRQTERALGEGVFGVPSMLADGELFWGFDDLPFLERFLAGDDPLDPASLSAWWQTRPSAERRRRP